MTDFALLNSADHNDVKVVTDRGAKYGDDMMYVLTFPFEFRNVQGHYPILFHKDTHGNAYPVALFGFQDRENLFLDNSGWDATYVPAMVRRAPFLIGYQGSEGEEDEDKARVLSIDMDHPRVSTEEGESLFQPLGGRTPFLESVANLLEDVYYGYIHNKVFMAALEEHELLESVTMDITLNDGSQNQLLGFSTIDEEKVQQLPGQVLAEFARQDILMPLFMVLASMVNVRSLIERKNRTLDAWQ